jgi:hypothetical protein
LFPLPSTDDDDQEREKRDGNIQQGAYSSDIDGTTLRDAIKRATETAVGAGTADTMGMMTMSSGKKKSSKHDKGSDATGNVARSALHGAGGSSYGGYNKLLLHLMCDDSQPL